MNVFATIEDAHYKLPTLQWQESHLCNDVDDAGDIVEVAAQSGSKSDSSAYKIKKPPQSVCFETTSTRQAA